MVSALAFGFALSLATGPVDDGPGPLADRVLVVGTKSTPPFVVHGQDGRWGGSSIELWREIAGELDLRFELQERDFDGLIRGLEDGSLDLAIAAITVTAERERRVDFSHPFFTTGLAIALAHGSYPGPAAGLAAINAREIDALVYDEPTLRALVETEYSTSIDLLPRSFQRQDYAFALPTGSSLREPINRILARRMPGF